MEKAYRQFKEIRDLKIELVYQIKQWEHCVIHHN